MPTLLRRSRPTVRTAFTVAAAIMPSATCGTSVNDSPPSAAEPTVGTTTTTLDDGTRPPGDPPVSRADPTTTTEPGAPAHETAQPPPTTLRHGDLGVDVMVVQRMLGTVLSDEMPDVWIPDTGFYDLMTADAVAQFQTMVGLPATGVAGGTTRSMLESRDAGRSDRTIPDTSPIDAGGADGCTVSIVGDSLTEPAVAAHRSALERIRCASTVDAMWGRSLNAGWQCVRVRSDATSDMVVVAEPEPGNPTCAPSGLELLERWERSGTLGDLVVVALGTNDAAINPDETIWSRRWERALDLTGHRPVVFVTTAVRPGGDLVPVQEAYSAALRIWCSDRERCHLADWARTTTATDADSYVDWVHLTPDATHRRVDFITAAVASFLVPVASADPASIPTPVVTGDGPPRTTRRSQPSPR